jgi:hypothetical protein
MSQRSNYSRASPAAVEALGMADRYVRRSGLPPRSRRMHPLVCIDTKGQFPLSACAHTVFCHERQDEQCTQRGARQ